VTETIFARFELIALQAAALTRRLPGEPGILEQVNGIDPVSFIWAVK
jgi:hypothetical protein